MKNIGKIVVITDGRYTGKIGTCIDYDTRTGALIIKLASLQVIMNVWCGECIVL